MHPWLRRCSIACILILLSAPAVGGETLRVGGSGVGLGALQVLAEAFERQHPGQTVLVLPSIGSTGGIRAVLAGKLEVGCTARPLQPEERVPGLAETPWAATPFVFATHPSTAPEALTLAGIEDLYAGRRKTWKDGRPIRLILRPKSDSSFSYLASLTPGMRQALEHAHALPGVSIGITDQEALTDLEKTPGSFGVAALGSIVSEGRRVQVFPVDGVRPGEENYPFVLTLFMIHRPGPASAATRAFLDFAHSKAGRRLLLQAGYQPLPASPPGSGR